MINKYYTKILTIVSICAVLFVLISTAGASMVEISFQKGAQPIVVGDTFTTVLKISSDQLVNVVDGAITYDPDVLAIKSISTSASSFSLWAQEPVFDNTKGELRFVGGAPDGLKDANGRIIDIVFMAKKEGDTTVGFKDIFSVYLHDGKGTSVNPWLKPLQLSIAQKSPSDARDPRTLGFVVGGILIVGIVMFSIWRNKKRSQ